MTTLLSPRTHAAALVVLALSVSAAPAVAAAPRHGRLVGHVSGRPTGALVPLVRVVNSHRHIIDIRGLNRLGGFAFSLPPGPYIVLGSAATPKGTTYRGATKPAVVHSLRRIRANVLVKTTKRKAKAKANKSRAAARRGRGAVVVTVGRKQPLAHSIVTVGAFSTVLSGPGLGVGLDLREHVSALLFNLCSGRGTSFVDSSPEVVTAIKQERALQLAGKLSTHANFTPLVPRWSVTGEAEIYQGTGNAPNNVGLKIHLRARDLKSGQTTLSGIWASIPPGSLDIAAEELLATVDVGVERFARAACGNGAI